MCILKKNIETIGAFLFSTEVDVAEFLEKDQDISVRIIELSLGVSREINSLINPSKPYAKIYPLRDNIRTTISYYNLFNESSLFDDDSKKKMFLNIDLYKRKPIFLSCVFFYSLLEFYRNEEDLDNKKAIKSLISLIYDKFLTYDIIHVVIEPKPLDRTIVSERTRSSATTRLSFLLSDSHHYYWARFDLPHLGQEYFHLNLRKLNQLGDLDSSMDEKDEHIKIDDIHLEPGKNPFNKIENYLITYIPYGNKLMSTVDSDFNVKNELLRYHLLSLVPHKIQSFLFSEKTFTKWPDGELNQILRMLLEQYPLNDYSESELNEPETWFLIGDEILRDAALAV